MADVKLENILFLDIETVPAFENYFDLPDNLKALWSRKAQKVSSKPGDTARKLYFQNAGIYSEFGKIVCISVGYFRQETEGLKFRVKSFFGHDEKAMLEEFSVLLNKHFNTPQHCLCGHNGKEFDFPYLSRRMLINQLPLPYLLDNAGKKPWEVGLLDTLELWKFGDYKNYTSLELLAVIFDIPTPKDDIKGSDVARVYWKEGNLERIAVYCAKDVVTLARVYMRFKLLGALNDSQIQYL
jgi:3'-5' exonuclease